MGAAGADSPLKMCATLVYVLLVISHVSFTSSSVIHDFDRAFQQFLQDNGYRGGVVAAMRDGKLVMTRGYGEDRRGKTVTSSSQFPISSVSKSLTAVAILQLVQNGQLTLKDKVFGESGILGEIRPWDKSKVDPRLADITVDHLLHHSAGWDHSHGPLYDPVLNQFYRRRGQKVPNIAQEMVSKQPLDPKLLISYVLSQPLQYQPGARTAYSNFGYLVLGRVIEAVSNTTYKDYARKNIVSRCGMWNTHIPTEAEPWDVMEVMNEGASVYQSLEPSSVDSTLGWQSNVYDMMRFVRCTFESQQVLNDRHLELLLSRTDFSEEDVWFAAGFRANAKNIVWQDADPHADDLILYHNTNPTEGHGSGIPDSWIIALYDNAMNHLRQQTKEIMLLLENISPQENLFLYDISELHSHPSYDPRQTYNALQYTIRYNLDEHQLSAYVDALQEEGLGIHWFTSSYIHDRTLFTIIGKQFSQPTRSQYDYLFEHGMSHRYLLQRKLQLEEVGYNMTQLHSYRSSTHSKQVVFAAVFRFEAFSVDKQMKYGTNHLPEPYDKLVEMYNEKHFYPICQTVVFENDKEEFSFIFVKDAGDTRIEFKHNYDLNTKRLAKLTTDNAKVHLHLSYLNAYDVDGKFKFAAVFSNVTSLPGALEVDQPESSATEMAIRSLRNGKIPKYIVSYLEDGNIKFAVYFEEV
uniref:Beta-lactamase-related domain-containing protein n=1 Tax=Biomphalaria glabrata TaxID=6526 RepID=A0A2C9M765_BIOGL